MRLNECTFNDNSASYGGAVYNKGTILDLSFCEFINNTASYTGGAIRNYEASIHQMERCIFDGNEAGVRGGGIASEDSTLEMESCHFESNIAHNGGAVANSLGNVSMVASTFVSNTATPTTGTSDGGALFGKGGEVEMSDCIFVGNEAQNRGGAVYLYASATVRSMTSTEFSRNAAGRGGAVASNENSVIRNMSGCTFTNNSASQDGGAVDNEQTSTIENLNDCTFTTNSARWSGGALNNQEEIGSVLGCVFLGNEAGVDGGAIQSDGGQIAIIDGCTMDRNYAAENGGAIVYKNATHQLNLTNTSFVCNVATSGSTIDTDGSSVVIYDIADPTVYGSAAFVPPTLWNSVVIPSSPEICGCDDGRWGARWGASWEKDGECEGPCAAGRYGIPGAIYDNDSCEGSCVSGWNCPKGSTNINGDRECEPGSYFEAGTDTECEDCSRGTFQNLFGQSACRSCVDQFEVAKERGMTECTRCRDDVSEANEEHTDCVCAIEFSPSDDECVRCAAGFQKRESGNFTCSLSQGFGCVLMTNRVDSVHGSVESDYVLASEWGLKFTSPASPLRTEWTRPTEISYSSYDVLTDTRSTGVATVEWFYVCPNWLMLDLGVPQRIGSVETRGCDAGGDESNGKVWVGNKIPRLWTDMEKNECDNDDVICLDHQYVRYEAATDLTVANGRTRFLPRRNGSHLVYGEYVFVTSVKPSCEIEAYETTSDVCGEPSAVNPFSARFYDLDYTSNQTHHYFTNAMAESVQGCTLTECMCGPNNSGRLCRNRVTSIRFDAYLDEETRPSFVNKNRRVLCGETTVDPRGAVDEESGVCDCNAFSGTGFNTDLFDGVGCQCVQHNGKVCAGHGTCYAPMMPYGRCDGVDDSKRLRGRVIDVMLYTCVGGPCWFQDSHMAYYRIDTDQVINLGDRTANETTVPVTIEWNASRLECIEFVVNGELTTYNSVSRTEWTIPMANDYTLLSRSDLEAFCAKSDGQLNNATFLSWNATLSALDQVNCTEKGDDWGQGCDDPIQDWDCTKETAGWDCIASPTPSTCFRISNTSSTTIRGILQGNGSQCANGYSLPTVVGLVEEEAIESCVNGTNCTTVPNRTVVRTRSDDPIWGHGPRLIRGTLEPIEQFGYQRGMLDCSDPIDRTFATAYALSIPGFDGELCRTDDRHTFWNVSTVGRFFGLFDTNHPRLAFPQDVSTWDPSDTARYRFISSILNDKWMLDQDPLVERPFFWEEYLKTSWTDTTKWDEIRTQILRDRRMPYNHAYSSLLTALGATEETKTSLLRTSIPGETRYFNLATYKDSPITQQRLVEFWQSSLAPIACTNDWQCESFNLGECEYQPSRFNAHQYRSWRNGVPSWDSERNIVAFGDEGGCGCHQNSEDGYWEPEWHCQRCREGYGPATLDEWNGFVRYNATLRAGLTMLDDTTFKQCVWPWAVDPILAGDNPRSICSGHGTFRPVRIEWDSNFTKPREVIRQNQWMPLDDPSICLVYNISSLNQLVYLQQNWVEDHPWYANDETYSLLYFTERSRGLVNGEWMDVNVTCQYYNHVV